MKFFDKANPVPRGNPDAPQENQSQNKPAVNQINQNQNKPSPQTNSQPSAIPTQKPQQRPGYGSNQNQSNNRKRFQQRRGINPAISDLGLGPTRKIPQVAPGKVRFIPLGGNGWVTKNMYLYEYGEDILIVDCGMGFPEEHMLGVDFVIPDVSYLKDKLNRVRGMIITHAHEDHIGGIGYILSQIKVPVYGTKLTMGLIKVRLQEMELADKVQLNVIDPRDHLKLGVFDIDPFRVSHSVPDAVGYAITTPAGTTIHTGDFKFDWTPVDGRPTDVAKIVRLTQHGCLALMSDCLRSERPGYTHSEMMIEDSFDEIIGKAPGKVVITTFSSNISRIQQAIDVSRRYGRKVVVSGRSMDQNLLTAQQLGYINLKPDWMARPEQALRMKDHQVTYIVSGAQGQQGSALWRIANNEHKFISVREGDTVIFSSDPIPGNQDNVYGVIDKLSQLGATVHYSDLTDEFHVSGHAAQAELMLMMSLCHPKYLVPVSGVYRQLSAYKQLAMKLGHEEKNIWLLEEGDMLEMDATTIRKTGKIPVENIMVDGLGVGDVGNVVLRDRQVLSEEGLVIILVNISKASGELIGNPDVISRGFVYAKENEKIIHDIAGLTRKVLTGKPGKIDWNYAKAKVHDELERFIFTETQRRPMILPLVMEV